MEALITNIQKFSIHDGEGIRTTVFLKGCPIHCKWCANPEAQNYKNELMHFKEKCKGCMNCVHACPNGALRDSGEGYPVYDKEKCALCGKCQEACLLDAIRLAAQKYTPQSLLESCMRDKPFYGERGGVTLSGGECLTFEPFVTEFLEKCKKHSIRATFETCGMGRVSTLMKYAECAQRIYFDVKHHDAETFRRVTDGGDLALILNNLRTLTESFENTAVRIPVVYGVNDSAEDMEKLAALIKETVGGKGILFVELLPFHNLGSNKYKALGIPYEFDGANNMNKDIVRAFIPIFEEKGFKCVVE